MERSLTVRVVNHPAASIGTRLVVSKSTVDKFCVRDFILILAKIEFAQAKIELDFAFWNKMPRNSSPLVPTVIVKSRLLHPLAGSKIHSLFPPLCLSKLLCPSSISSSLHPIATLLNWTLCLRQRCLNLGELWSVDECRDDKKDLQMVGR